MSETEVPQEAPITRPFPEIRSRLPITAPFDWLRAGLVDLRASGLPSIFYGVCFALMGGLFLLAFNRAVQLVTAVTTGFMLLGPFLAIGLYDLSRQHEQGEKPRLLPTLMAWQRNLRCMSLYSLILIIIYLVWARASLVVFAVFYQGGMPSMEAFIAQLSKFDNIEFMIAYLIIGGLFASLVFAFSVVSIPTMLDRDQDSITAMIASFLAVVRNLPTMLVWALLIVLLTALGVATGFIGLIFTIPLVGHATWHAYRAAIKPLPPDTPEPPAPAATSPA